MTVEDRHQKALFEWAAAQAGKHPELHLMYAVPNGGYRPTATGRKMKLTGQKAGVPDVCLPIPRGDFGALYVEMKKPAVPALGQRKGVLSKNQKAWIEKLNEVGNKAVVAYGWEDAKNQIMEYLTDE